MRRRHQTPTRGAGTADVRRANGHRGPTSKGNDRLGGPQTRGRRSEKLAAAIFPRSHSHRGSGGRAHTAPDTRSKLLSVNQARPHGSARPASAPATAMASGTRKPPARVRAAYQGDRRPRHASPTGCLGAHRRVPTRASHAGSCRYARARIEAATTSNQVAGPQIKGAFAGRPRRLNAGPARPRHELTEPAVSSTGSWS